MQPTTHVIYATLYTRKIKQYLKAYTLALDGGRPRSERPSDAGRPPEGLRPFDAHQGPAKAGRSQSPRGHEQLAQIFPGSHGVNYQARQSITDHLLATLLQDRDRRPRDRVLPAVLEPPFGSVQNRIGPLQMLQNELVVPRSLPQQELVVPVAVMREQPLQERVVGRPRVDRFLVEQPQQSAPVALVQVRLRRPDDAVLRRLVQQVDQRHGIDQVLVFVVVVDDLDVLLEVAIFRRDQIRVVVQQLQPLLEVVVAEVLESGAGLPAASGWILEPGGVDEEDAADGVRRRRDRAVDQGGDAVERFGVEPRGHAFDRLRPHRLPFQTFLNRRRRAERRAGRARSDHAAAGQAEDDARQFLDGGAQEGGGALGGLGVGELVAVVGSPGCTTTLHSTRFRRSRHQTHLSQLRRFPNGRLRLTRRRSTSARSRSPPTRSRRRTL
jgi:hypothetical protein